MFNKIHLTVFTLLVFVCCVVIFPIYCDLSDFLWLKEIAWYDVILWVLGVLRVLGQS